MKNQEKALICILFITVFLTGCSDFKKSIYEEGIAYQINDADLEEKHVDLGEVNLAYLESKGSNTLPSLILIHGLGSNKSNWLEVSKNLNDKFHIYSIDLPGHGDTKDNVERSYDIQAQVEVIQKFSKALNIDKFHIAAHSMGGAIAARYTAQSPEKVLSLSLISPVGYYENWDKTELGLQVQKGNNPLAPKNEEEFEFLLEFSMNEPLFIPWPFKEFAAKEVISNFDRTTKVFKDFSQSTLDQRNILKTIKTKSLILWGDQDRILPPENASQFGELLDNSTVVILSDIGHTPILEAPEETSLNILSVAFSKM